MATQKKKAEICAIFKGETGWVARWVAGNGEIRWSGEPVTKRQSLERAVRNFLQNFGIQLRPCGRDVIRGIKVQDVLQAYSGWREGAHGEDIEIAVVVVTLKEGRKP